MTFFWCSLVLALCKVTLGSTVSQATTNDASTVSIPIIDLAAWTTHPQENDNSVRLATARVVEKACREIGFFAITNHGVNVSVMDLAWETTREFFDLPMGTKLQSATDNSTRYPYGYEQSESLVAGKQLDSNRHDSKATSPPDLKETYSLGPSSGMPARQYPEHPLVFKEAMDAYYQEMESLAAILLRIFAVALNLPEFYFEPLMDRHMSALRILNYFEVKAGNIEPGQLRTGAHTDYGALTILKSGGPGLQVMPADGTGEESWVDVPYSPDMFIINLGDLMQRWTNDEWVSTLHRVIATSSNGASTTRRQSIAYFVNINGDAKVTPFESCVKEGENPRYPPILARDHLMAKHLASMGESNDLGDEPAAKEEL